MRLRTFYSTIVLSDIHLGTSHSKTVEVSNFLKSVNCRRLILNGDIIDGWALSKGGTWKWQAKHTDFFKVTTRMKWLAQLGDVGYTFLLWLNRIYNVYRARRGQPYYSLSQAIKQKVKSAVSYISDFEEELVKFARTRKCDGIICGHIHHSANTYYDDIHYLNSGDWVETLSALVEDEEGNWEVLRYEDMLMNEKPEERFCS